MIVYFLVSVAVVIGIIFVMQGYSALVLPLYVIPAIIGFIIRGFWTNLESKNKYVVSLLLSIIQSCVLFSGGLFRSWESIGDFVHSGIEAVKYCWPLPILFYITALASFWKNKTR